MKTVIKVFTSGFIAVCIICFMLLPTAILFLFEVPRHYVFLATILWAVFWVAGVVTYWSK